MKLLFDYFLINTNLRLKHNYERINNKILVY